MKSEMVIGKPLLGHRLKIQKAILTWYDRHRILHPWREHWEKSGDPYVILLSEIMLQQTTLQAVTPAYKEFYKNYPTIEALARADEESIRIASKGLGYYRRFGNLLRTAKLIKAKGRWPKEYRDWLALPGIGDYTASAIVSICFGQPQFVVDGNIERVLFRLLDLRGEVKPFKKDMKAIGNQLIALDRPGDFNQGMMELGQTVCSKSGKPICRLCPLKGVCLARRNDTQDLALPVKVKIAFQEVHVRMVIYRKKGRYGIIKRPNDAMFLKNTYGFPYTVQEDQTESGRYEEIGQFKHSITKYKLKVRVEWGKSRAPLGMEWLDKKDLEKRLYSNFDRKAWALLSPPITQMA